METLDRFKPLMSEALHCASGPEGPSLPLEEVQARLVRLADEERAIPLTAADVGVAPAKGRGRLERRRFAVYAWVDEKMLNAPRPDAPAWMGLGLQSRYFGTTEGGHIFFAHLEEILDDLGIARLKDGMPLGLDRRLELAAELPANTPGREVLAVHALCLLYGFSGRLWEAPELLVRIRKAAYGLVPRHEEPAQRRRALLVRESGRSLLGSLEPALYALVPIAVTALFALFCAAVLANIPVRGL